jgi:CyaY protein
VTLAAPAGALYIRGVDERIYERLAGAAFKRVIDLFEDIDPDDADVDSSGDVVRIELAGGRRVVLNTQRPVRQIWLAGGQAAWHFGYDPESERWLDDKGRGELFSVLRAIVRELSGLQLPD